MSAKSFIWGKVELKSPLFDHMRNTGKNIDQVARGEEHAPDSPVQVLKQRILSSQVLDAKPTVPFMGTQAKIHSMNVPYGEEEHF